MKWQRGIKDIIFKQCRLAMRLNTELQGARLDNYIQELFNAKIGEWIILLDHSNCRIGDDGLFHKVRNRMKCEHGIDLEVKRRNNKFVVRIPESVMTHIANRRAMMIEDTERGLNTIEKQ